MTHGPGTADPLAIRITNALRDVDRSDVRTLVLSSGSAEPRTLETWIRGFPPGAARVLVLGALGTHRDARGARLRHLWEVEETARGSGHPVLALRFGPVLGPQSPLWLRLRTRPRLGRRAELLASPVAESDAHATVERALTGGVPWDGWFEVAGPEALTLAELVDLAGASSPGLPAGSGGWEPELSEIEEHRLVEGEPWRSTFEIPFRPLAEWRREWA